TAEQFVLLDGRSREGHHWAGDRPLSRRARFGRLLRLLDRHRQRDRRTLVAHDALDFALHIVSKLARAVVGEINAIAAAQAPDLTFIVRTLRRVAAGLVDETVPDVGVDDARLLGPTAVNFVEIGRVLAWLGAALRRQPDPDHRNAGALERRDGRIDALD